MKFKYLLIFTLPFYITSFSQSNNQAIKAYIGKSSYEIDSAFIQKINLPKMIQFQGYYHLGESEDVPNLEVLCSNGKLYARSTYSDWENDKRVNKVFRERIRYFVDSIQINKTFYKLYRFVKNKNKMLEKGDVGLISKTDNNTQFNYQSNLSFSGRFPEASFVKLTMNDIKAFSKIDLKIMRNEIFARRGHVFYKGKQMDRYFKKQDWYNILEKKGKILLDDLSEIERYNTDLIMQLEVK
ncbi:YARHG domain-containing protein [uncultured Lacinutrix sp.]|uniref:YARHG domain-containing protein n=1 Tax=uncultured Lacinutrix sp. TaxID=574032 RepID=UPI00262533FC|nr:YARHG domain-containing protein [uncultured Lacinutrix sp.]